MNRSEVTAPTSIAATCIDCENQRRFSMGDSDSGALVAFYECNTCGHTITLALNGRDNP